MQMHFSTFTTTPMNPMWYTGFFSSIRPKWPWQYFVSPHVWHFW